MTAEAETAAGRGVQGAGCRARGEAGGVLPHLLRRELLSPRFGLLVPELQDTFLQRLATTFMALRYSGH